MGATGGTPAREEGPRSDGFRSPHTASGVREHSGSPPGTARTAEAGHGGGRRRGRRGCGTARCLRTSDEQCPTPIRPAAGEPSDDGSGSSARRKGITGQRASRSSSASSWSRSRNRCSKPSGTTCRVRVRKRCRSAARAPPPWRRPRGRGTPAPRGRGRRAYAHVTCAGRGAQARQEQVAGELPHHLHAPSSVASAGRPSVRRRGRGGRSSAWRTRRPCGARTRDETGLHGLLDDGRQVLLPRSSPSYGGGRAFRRRVTA